MVYHEIRKINRNIYNYLVYNLRKNGKWKKKSRFIGKGKIEGKKLKKLKNEFRWEILAEKSKFLSKKQVIELENFKKKYNKKINSLNKEEFGKFEEAFFTELTYNSNAIEGNSLSLEETSLVINEGIVPKGKTLREIHEAKNHVEALEFLKNYEGDLNENLMLKLHSLILKNISERFAGTYRTSNVKIAGSTFKPPAAEKVPQLVKNLVYWYKKNKNEIYLFELAILFSAKFVTIHPFVDGNGRVSRLLMNFLLKKNNHPLINIYKKNRQDYLNAIRKSNDEDYSLIIPFILKNLKQNLKEFGVID